MNLKKFLGCLYLAGGTFVFTSLAFVSYVLRMTRGRASNEGDFFTPLLMAWTRIPHFYLIVSFEGLLLFAIGTCLLLNHRLARTAAIVLAILELIGFPTGTALGLFTLWILFRKPQKTTGS